MTSHEMGQLYVPVVLETTILLAGYALASRLPGLMRPVIRLIVAFWFVSYVIRPMFTAWENPGPNNPLYDARLAQFGYATSLAVVLRTVVVGNGCFLITIFAWSLWRKWRNRGSETANNLSFARFSSGGDVRQASQGCEELLHGMRTLALIYTLGWAGRCLALSGVAGPLAQLLAPVTLPAASLLLLDRRLSTRLVAVITFGEVLWTILSGQKTFSLICLFVLGMRTLRDEHSRLRLRVIAPVFLTGATLFLLVQNLRDINTSTTAYQYTDSGNRVVGPVYGILERADGVSTVQDALSFGHQPWLSLPRYISHVVSNALPHGGILNGGPGDGFLWTREVRSVSQFGQYQGVSIAFGPTAEGYAEAKLVGVIITNTLFAVMVLVLLIAVHSRFSAVRVVAATWVFSNGFLERGLLSLLDGLAKGLEIFVLYLVCAALVRSRYSRNVQVRNASYGEVSGWSLKNAGAIDRG